MMKPLDRNKTLAMLHKMNERAKQRATLWQTEENNMFWFWQGEITLLGQLIHRIEQGHLDEEEAEA